MRKTAPLLLASLLLIPALAFASIPPDPSANPNAASTNASKPDPKDDPCYSLTLTIVKGSPVQTYSKTPNSSCEKLEKNYSSPEEACKNSAFKQQASTFKYTDPGSDGQSHTLSRCDQLSGNAPDINATTAQSIALQSVNDIDPTTATGQQQLSQALQNLGVSQTDAQTLAQNQPDQVKSLLSDIAQGNTSDAQTLANSLDLNSDVVNNISQLQPGNLPTVLDGVASQDQENGMTQALSNPNAASTIPPTGDDNTPTDQPAQQPLQCGVGGYAGNIARAETNCGAVTTNPYSSVQGPYQFLCSTWNSYANSTGNSQYTCSCGSSGYVGTCSYVNDPTISSNVVNSYYNNWVNSSQGQACIAAGNTDTSCVYAYHWLGGGGLNAALSLETSNPNGAATQLCSSAASAACSAGNMSLGGLTMSQVFQQLDARQGIGGTVIASMAGAGSPIAAATPDLGGGSVYSAGSVVSPGVSPLAAAGLIPTSASGNIGGNSSLNSLLPLLLMRSLLNPQSAQSTPPPPPPPVQSAATTPVQTPTSGTTQPSTTASVDTISAQPPIVVPPASITVTWSSSGVAATPPCKITTQNGSTIAQSNNGSTNLATNASTPVGKATFTISCTSTSGQTLQQSASVVIN